MTLELKLPNQITLVNSDAIQCESLSSNVDDDIECTYNTEKGSIEISEAFTTRIFDHDDGIVLSLGPLKNPDSLQTTDSFEISSLTKEGYLIDF